MTSRISKISIFTHCNDLGGKVWNPAIRWTRKHAVFVLLEDEDGRQGLGECWCFDSEPDALVTFLRTEVVPHFIGELLDDINAIAERLIQRATLTARHGMLASSISGIDIAAWDLRAQHEDKPVWQHLSKAGTGQARLYISGGLYGEGKTPDLLAQEMAGHAKAGFRLLKMKIGAESMETDILRVHAVLNILPADAKLIIDGVYSYSADDALRLYETLPQERIEAFQSPTKATDYDGMIKLSKAGVPVMATEAEYRYELHQKLVEEVGVRYLQTAPVACGGISRVQTLSKMVANTSTRLSLEVSSTAIALMAASQIAAADSNIAHVEYHTVHTVFFDKVRLQRQKQSVDMFSLPAQKGLGIELPMSEVSLAHSTINDANLLQQIAE